MPQGARLDCGTEEGRKGFAEMEAKGMEVVGQTAFVMVAGGLGERLGYNGIKIELPSEITTGCLLLELLNNLFAFFFVSMNKLLNHLTFL